MSTKWGSHSIPDARFKIVLTSSGSRTRWSPSPTRPQLFSRNHFMSLYLFGNDSIRSSLVLPSFLAFFVIDQKSCQVREHPENQAIRENAHTVIAPKV